ncbi:MAG: YkgJ family cysteine cluster protein [Desulfovibrio sp.]
MFLPWRLKGMWRTLWIKFTGKKIVVRGNCKMCGKCCRDISLFVDGRWMRSEKHLREYTKDYPEYSRFEPTGFDHYGHLTVKCTLLGDDGMCTDYENRLDLCEDHPAASHYYSGATLNDWCGYRIDVIKPFETTLKKARKEEAKRSLK